MTTIIGNFSLCGAVLVAVSAIVAAFIGGRFGSATHLRVARWLIAVYQVLLVIAAAALVTALVNNDFSLRYVAEYTEKALPLGYKLAAFWAGQEGSILLWAFLLGAMVNVFVFTTRKQNTPSNAGAIATLAIVNMFFALLLLFAANPFTTAPAPADGHGLNPMLQNSGMIAHPPMLFLGYAGFTIPFAIFVGALVAGREDDGWVVTTRRWLLISWTFLSIGILLGAQWAYVELGWGGYWAWDPVENASLLPWLTGTALVHSIMAQQQRGMMRMWNALLFAITFILCIFGTYLTRSGVVESVHSFGQSLVGTLFLVFLAIITLGSLALIIWRRRLLRSAREIPALLGREAAFMMTNVILLGMAALTLIGTIFPIISNAFSGQQVSVGANFYNRAVAPMGMLLIGLMAIGPLLVYGKNPGEKLKRRIVLPGAAAILVVIALLIFGIRSSWGIACGAVTAFGIFAIVADLTKVVKTRVREHHENALVALGRAIDGNHRRYGGQITHAGIIMIMVGVVGSSVFGKKQDFQLHPGDSVSFAGHTLTYVSLDEKPGPNYTAVDATLKLADADGNTQIFHPQRRFYAKAEQPSTEVALDSTWKKDIYLTLAGWEAGGKTTAFEAVLNPLVSWIWTGGFVLTGGALLSMCPQFVKRSKKVALKIGLTTCGGGASVPLSLATGSLGKGN